MSIQAQPAFTLAKSHTVSALARRFRASDLTLFQAFHSHDWLLWERNPERGGSVRLVREQPHMNSVAIPLEATLLDGGQLTVGRSSDADLEISDGTLSMLHLVLVAEPTGGWTIRDAGSTNGTWVNGHRVKPGEPVPLTSGDRIQAAQVCMTFLGPPDMYDRLQRELSAS